MVYFYCHKKIFYIFIIGFLFGSAFAASVNPFSKAATAFEVSAELPRQANVEYSYRNRKALATGRRSLAAAKTRINGHFSDRRSRGSFQSRRFCRHLRIVQCIFFRCFRTVLLCVFCAVYTAVVLDDSKIRKYYQRIERLANVAAWSKYVKSHVST